LGERLGCVIIQLHQCVRLDFRLSEHGFRFLLWVRASLYENALASSAYGRHYRWRGWSRIWQSRCLCRARSAEAPVCVVARDRSGYRCQISDTSKLIPTLTTWIPMPCVACRSARAVDACGARMPCMLTPQPRLSDAQPTCLFRRLHEEQPHK